MEDKDVIITDLRAFVESLRAEVKSLKLELAKAKKDSSTSSKSPSSDIVKPPKKKTDRRKKSQQGGQQGHKRKLREPLPPDRVDESFVYEIDEAEVRDRELTATDEFEIIQHIELLDLPVHVTEHQLRKYIDRDGNTVLPDVPELKGPIFGLRMLAMIGWLKSRAHCSYSTVAQWMSDVLQIPVSRGYLAKLCNGTISASLADAHEELKHAIPHQSHLGSDESSLRFLEIIRKPPDCQDAWNLTNRFRIVEYPEGDTFAKYDMSEDYFRFMFEASVEPTNNHAEQQVRHCVIDRKITQGTRSLAGQRYHERMWTAIATCGKQKKSFFDFLRVAIKEKLAGNQSPSLIKP